MGEERPPVNANYRSFFGMSREAFPTELSLKDILETPDIAAIKERFDYTLRLGAIAIVTWRGWFRKVYSAALCGLKAPSI